RNSIIRADYRDFAGTSFSPQHFPRGITCSAASHDDDVLRRSHRLGRRFLRGVLSAHEKLATAGFNLPRTNRVERWRAERLTRAKAETGVMPRTSDCIIHQEALGQRGAIVGAGRAYGEVGICAPNHHYGLALGVAQQHAIPLKLGESDTLREVKSAQFLSFRHFVQILPRTICPTVDHFGCQTANLLDGSLRFSCEPVLPHLKRSFPLD